MIAIPYGVRMCCYPGMISLIYSAKDSDDILTEASLTAVAAAEAEVLALRAQEWDDASIGAENAPFGSDSLY